MTRAVFLFCRRGNAGYCSGLCNPAVIIPLENAEGQHLSWIVGGLKSGHNEIAITTVKKDEYSRPPEIRVKVPVKGMHTEFDEPPDSPGTVFYLKPKELGITQTLGFDVLKKQN